MVSQHSNSVNKKPPPTKPKPNNNKNKNENKESLQVFCRLRPIKNINDTIVVNKIDDQTLELSSPANNQQKQLYKYQKVFDPNIDQHQLFKQTTFQLVKDLIDGRNGLLFSYGVTSSGKTYTITGTPQQPGIIPRTLDTIFNTLNKNDLQHMRYGFKSNNKNGFEIVLAPDAILKLQNEQNTLLTTTTTPNKTTTTPRKRINDIVYDWDNRIQEEMFVKDINHDNKYSIFISYVEVYNNYIYDLLDDQTSDNNNKCSKRIVEDVRKRLYVHNVKEVEVKSSREAFELCLRGMKRRRIGMTKLNNESSRSHSVFNIRLVQAPLDNDGVELLNDNNLIHVSQLSIVDLAGCERTSRTQATGNCLREASNINNSLLTLRQCFDVLRENQKLLSSSTSTTGVNNLKIVPYRDNKLTHMFKNYFEGDGKVVMICCINPGLEDFDETIQVCKFGEISQDIYTFNNNVDLYSPLKRLRQQYNSTTNYITSTIQLLPTLPTKNYIDDPFDNDTIQNWIQILSKRCEYHEKNSIIIEQYQENVREKINDLNNSNVLIEQENSVLKMDLMAREQQLREYENKYFHMEQKYETEMNRMQCQIQELQEELSNLNHKLITTEIEKTNISNEFRQYRRSTKEQWKMEFKRLQKLFIDKINDAEAEMEKKMATNQEKLQLVQKIINNDFNFETLRPTWMSPIKLTDNNNDVITTTAQNELKSPPVINPGYRRSLSSGDLKWIEHRPPGTINLGTIFQPSIQSKRKKSVTNLKTSDFVGKSNEIASKYAITHHTATVDGLVETKVYKGDVIPSITGGSQVIFNDVEKLVQIPCNSNNNNNNKNVVSFSPSDHANITIRNNRKRLIDVFERITTTTTTETSSPSTPSSSSSSSSSPAKKTTVKKSASIDELETNGGNRVITPSKRSKY